MRRSRLMVSKCGGAREPLSFVKLRRCVESAIAGVQGDVHAASPLAEAVVAHLESCGFGEPPCSGYVFECVCTVLMQTGMHGAAEGLSRHRDRRQRVRRQIRIAHAGEAKCEEWSKARLAASLERGGIGHGAARAIASEIESRVLSLGYRRVSTELIAALAENELSEWGLVGDWNVGLEAVACETRAAAEEGGETTE